MNHELRGFFVFNLFFRKGSCFKTLLQCYGILLALLLLSYRFGFFLIGPPDLKKGGYSIM